MKSRLTFILINILSFAVLAVEPLVDHRDPVVHQWLKFMKYEKKQGRYQSPVTNPAFFLAEGGAKDATLELQKSIEQFSKNLPTSDQHPQCLYPARYEILRKKFPLAKPVACASFDTWRDAYGVTNINILYGSQYISNPTSAFGHSFFLIDSDKTIEYMRVTYNYGADIPKDPGIGLVVDGLGGGYKGYYSVVPLYHRLHSYNDIENRDIWEYTLKLTPEERDLVVKGLWEVQEKFSAPYYFLTGNCASELLEIVNVVRPALSLKTSSALYSSPQEIFRVLHENDLIASFKYRPSLGKQLDQKFKALSEKQMLQFEEALTTTQDFPRDALLAETALSYVQLMRQKNLDETPESLKPFERKALLARAEIKDSPLFQVPKESWPAAPHQAQGPQVIGLGRSKENSNAATSFVLRPAFHDLMQTDAGFLTDSSIDVLTFEGSIPDGDKARIDSLTLGKIVNFREVKTYDPLATSWMVGGKFIRNPFLKEELRYRLDVATEIGFATRASSLLLFGLAGLDLRDGSVEPFGRFGFGPRVGAIGTFGHWKIYATHRMSWQSSDAQTWLKRESDFKLRYNLNQAWDLLAQYYREETARNDKNHEKTDASIRYSF